MFSHTDSLLSRAHQSTVYDAFLEIMHRNLVRRVRFWPACGTRSIFGTVKLSVAGFSISSVKIRLLWRISIVFKAI